MADLVAAISLHVGEVARNAYHLRLPAWMMDNVRRGAELVGGQGSTAPRFTFATLYRLRRWADGRLHEVLERGQISYLAKHGVSPNQISLASVLAAGVGAVSQSDCTRENLVGHGGRAGDLILARSHRHSSGFRDRIIHGVTRIP